MMRERGKLAEALHSQTNKQRVANGVLPLSLDYLGIELCTSLYLMTLSLFANYDCAIVLVVAGRTKLPEAKPVEYYY